MSFMLEIFFGFVVCEIMRNLTKGLFLFMVAPEKKEKTMISLYLFLLVSSPADDTCLQYFILLMLCIFFWGLVIYLVYRRNRNR